jgi:hypothetical protein
VAIRNQPLRVVVVIGLWAMFVLWTITRFTSTIILEAPNTTTTTCPNDSGCSAAAAVEVTRQFSWSWWHFLFSLVGFGLLLAASIMILRSPRSLEEI